MFLKNKWGKNMYNGDAYDYFIPVLYEYIFRLLKL